MLFGKTAGERLAMRSLLSILLLLSVMTSANAAVNLAVSQQSGAVVQERAGQLARQLGSKLGTVINVIVLPDAVQVEAWLNRYATAELALVENAFVAGKLFDCKCCCCDITYFDPSI